MHYGSEFRNYPEEFSKVLFKFFGFATVSRAQNSIVSQSSDHLGFSSKLDSLISEIA